MVQELLHKIMYWLQMIFNPEMYILSEHSHTCRRKVYKQNSRSFKRKRKNKDNNVHTHYKRTEMIILSGFVRQSSLKFSLLQSSKTIPPPCQDIS